MRSRLKKFLLAFPGFQGLCRFATRRHVRVLMYHRFNNLDGQPTSGPDRQTLAWQMAMVKAHHAVWSASRHHELLAGKRSIGGACPVVVTVDDGYRDFRDVALPIFKAHGIPALLFVTTDFVDGGWMWWDKLTYIFESAAPDSVWLDHAGERYCVDLTTPETRNATWHRIGLRCCFLPEETKLTLLATLAERFAVEIPASPPARFAALTWDELREAQRDGIDIGAHTVTHAILTRVPLAVARQEIEGAKQRIEAMLGSPVPWFCFPQGGPADHSPELVAEIAAAGFLSSYLAFPERVEPASLYTLPRWSAPSDRTDFQWILCGAAYLDLVLGRLLSRDRGPGESYWGGAVADVADVAREAAPATAARRKVATSS